MTELAIFGDFHLGADFCPGADWLLGELQDACPDVVVFTGDLVDMHAGTPEDIGTGAALCRAITRDLVLPLVMVWGNHDAALGLHSRFPQIPGVYRPGSLDRVETLRVPGIPVAFHAINTAARLDERSVIEMFPHPDRDADIVNVGVVHTSLSGQWSRKPCLPVSLGELVAVGYDAWALGHVHAPPAELGGSASQLIAWPGVGELVRWRL